MVASLTDIMATFAGQDIARPNLFKVRIPYLGRDFEFRCRASQIPPGIVEKVPVLYQNKKINIAGDRTYDDWTVTVYNDPGHEIREKIMSWQSLMQTSDALIYGLLPEIYKKTATVIQLDRTGAERKSYTLIGVFPTNVAPIELDWDNNNQVEVFQVTLAVDWINS